MGNVIGFLKFIDTQFSNDYFNLSNIWLSNISNFTNNTTVDKEDLINDNDEGRAVNLASDMPAFITCFTVIRDTDFGENGKLNFEMCNSLLKSEEVVGKQRPFVIIPKANMDRMVEAICEFNEEHKTFPFNESAVFVREIKYIEDYDKKAKEAEKDFFKEKNVEKLGNMLYATKDVKYAIQHELRIGIVYPVEQNNFYEKEGRVSGILLDLEKMYKVATKKFDRDSLIDLTRSDFKI